MSVEQTAARLLLVGVRVAGLMAFVPFFGSGAVAARIKVGLTVALTVFLYPFVSVPATDTSRLNWFSLVTSETAAALLIGLSIQFVFEGVQLAGQVLGFQLGFGLENVIDPQTLVETPVLSTFQQSIALLLFLQLGVYSWLLRGLAESFRVLPLGQSVAKASTLDGLVHASADMVRIGIQLAAPVLIATLLVDVTLGFIGRASPQLPVMLLGISVKDLLGVGVLWGTIVLWPSQLQGYFERALALSQRLLSLTK